MTNEFQYFHVDVFARAAFQGNPAGVIPVEVFPDDRVMQAIAFENGLAETAFFRRVHEDDADFALRWFTPAVEMDLCGHATLATAYVAWSHLGIGDDKIRFSTKSGIVAVVRRGELLELDFPTWEPQPIAAIPGLAKALGAEPAALLRFRDVLVVLDKEADVRDLTPDLRALAGYDEFAFCVTAPGNDCDFVSRFFAPKAGVPEDPATGSAHCMLIPYWAKRLGKGSLFAKQLSPRGGEFWCEQRGERVGIAGKVRPYLQGTIRV